jgi:hypothetical protein
MALPGLHWKAVSNSFMLTATPLMRQRPGECGSVACLHALASGRWVLAVPLREADEEALLGGEAVDGLERFISEAFTAFSTRDPGEDGAAKVGHVLTQGQLAR